MNPLSRIPTVLVDYLTSFARLSCMRSMQVEFYLKGCNIDCPDYSLLL